MRDYLVQFFFGLIAAGLLAWSQVNLWRSRRCMRDARELRERALLEFERWRKAADALDAERDELRRAGLQVPR